MRKEAEAHAEEDRKRKEAIEVKNTADSTVYTVEKTLEEYGDKLPADLKAQVESKTSELKGMLETADTDTLKAKTEELNKLLQQLGGAMYQQPGQDPNASAGYQPGDMGGDNGSTGSNGGDDVVDGEFTPM
jgi:molecular chaperone DnaK